MKAKLSKWKGFFLVIFEPCVFSVLEAPGLL